MNSNHDLDLIEEIDKLNERLNRLEQKIEPKLEQKMEQPNRKKSTSRLFIFLVSIFLLLMLIGIIQFISGGNQ